MVLSQQNHRSSHWSAATFDWFATRTAWLIQWLGAYVLGSLSSALGFRCSVLSTSLCRADGWIQLSDQVTTVVPLMSTVCRAVYSVDLNARAISCVFMTWLDWRFLDRSLSSRFSFTLIREYWCCSMSNNFVTRQLILELTVGRWVLVRG